MNTTGETLIDIYEKDFVEYDRTHGEPRKMAVVRGVNIYIVGTSIGYIRFFDYRTDPMILVTNAMRSDTGNSIVELKVFRGSTLILATF